jgi:hypothetical protein
MSEGEVNVQRFTRTDFNQIVAESVHEAFDTILGPTASGPLVIHLQSYHGIADDEIPSHVEQLFNALNKSFGISGITLCKAIVKRMYKKVGVPFYEVGYRPMMEYVQELETKLANTGNAKE